MLAQIRKSQFQTQIDVRLNSHMSLSKYFKFLSVLLSYLFKEVFRLSVQYYDIFYEGKTEIQQHQIFPSVNGSCSLRLDITLAEIWELAGKNPEYLQL